MYHKIGGGGAILPFLQQICYSLIQGEGNTDDEALSNNSNRSLKRKHIPDYIRHDAKTHWPIQIDGCAQRCKAEGCKKNPVFTAKNVNFLCVLMDQYVF